MPHIVSKIYNCINTLFCFPFNDDNNSEVDNKPNITVHDESEHIYDGENIIETLIQKINERQDFSFDFKYKDLNKVSNWIKANQPKYDIIFKVVWYHKYNDDDIIGYYFSPSHLYHLSMWK